MTARNFINELSSAIDQFEERAKQYGTINEDGIDLCIINGYAVLRAEVEDGDEKFTFDGGKVEYCYSDERIRIYFDNIPDVEMRAKLKSEAFKWSPKNQAWQRQLTPNAVRAAKRVLGVEKFGA